VPSLRRPLSSRSKSMSLPSSRYSGSASRHDSAFHPLDGDDLEDPRERPLLSRRAPRLVRSGHERLTSALCSVNRPTYMAGEPVDVEHVRSSRRGAGLELGARKDQELPNHRPVPSSGPSRTARARVASCRTLLSALSTICHGIARGSGRVEPRAAALDVAARCGRRPAGSSQTLALPGHVAPFMRRIIHLALSDSRRMPEVVRMVRCRRLRGAIVVTRLVRISPQDVCARPR